MPYTWSPGWMGKVGAGSWGWGGSQQQHKEDRLFFAFEIENYHTKYLRQQFFFFAKLLDLPFAKHHKTFKSNFNWNFFIKCRCMLVKSSSIWCFQAHGQAAGWHPPSAKKWVKKTNLAHLGSTPSNHLWLVSPIMSPSNLWGWDLPLI